MAMQPTSAPNPDLPLSVMRWAVWAPNQDICYSRSGSQSNAIVRINEEEPDVKFIPAMVRRRLNRVGRMAFRVAADCIGEDLLGDEGATLITVFSSRYGDFAKAFEMMNGFVTVQAPSPATFSHSVHNSVPGILSILAGSNMHATAVSGAEASLEVGFLEAWALIEERTASNVLLIFVDEPLPSLFSDVPSNVPSPAALAMLLSSEDKAQQRLTLSWSARTKAVALNDQSEATRGHPAVGVARLLAGQESMLKVQTNRLEWLWGVTDAPD